MMAPSRTISCKRCGDVGETHKIWAGWYCKECLDAIQKAFDEGKSGVKVSQPSKELRGCD